MLLKTVEICTDIEYTPPTRLSLWYRETKRTYKIDFVFGRKIKDARVRVRFIGIYYLNKRAERSMIALRRKTATIVRKCRFYNLGATKYGESRLCVFFFFEKTLTDT